MKFHQRPREVEAFRLRYTWGGEAFESSNRGEWPEWFREAFGREPGSEGSVWAHANGSFVTRANGVMEEIAPGDYVVSDGETMWSERPQEFESKWAAAAPTRGIPEGLPVDVYCWTSERGDRILRLSARTKYADGKPRKTGVAVNMTRVPESETAAVVGESVIALVTWTCRDEPLAGDTAYLSGGRTYDIRACDITETGEYPETTVEAGEGAP